jgi:hypothetical protein
MGHILSCCQSEPRALIDVCSPVQLANNKKEEEKIKPDVRGSGKYSLMRWSEQQNIGYTMER